MERTLIFSTNRPTHCRICKGELPTEYEKKTCHACLVREKQRDTVRRQKRKFEEIENTVLRDLPAKVMKKELQIKKASDMHTKHLKKLNRKYLQASDVEFKSKEDLLQQLRLAFEAPSGQVIFRGCAAIAIDPMANAKEVTTMMAADIWRVSGYRFRCEHPRLFVTRF